MTKLRGFALMDKAKRVAIATRGGQNVPNEKRAFSTNRQLAIEAGRKGGSRTDPNTRSFTQDRELAVRAGRKGGRAAQAQRRGK